MGRPLKGRLERDKRMSMRLPGALLTAAERLAVEGTTVTDVMIDALTEYLVRRGKWQPRK